MMKMRSVEAAEITPGEPSVLQPGGLHVMLMGLTEPLVEGNSLPLTLNFERAGSIEVKVMIFEPEGMAMATEARQEQGRRLTEAHGIGLDISFRFRA